MPTRFLWLLLVVLGMGFTPAWGGVYEEDFSSSTGGYQLTSLPKGWDVIGDMAAFECETEKYHKAKPGIAIHRNTENYLVTPVVRGTVGFYLRNYTKNYAAQAQVFACEESADGTLAVGELIHETTLTKNNTQWGYATFDLTSATRVALLLSTAVIDDFSASELVAASDSTEGNDPPQVDEVRILTITSFERTCDYELTANDQNEYAAAFRLVVKNMGNVALAPEEVSVSVVDREGNTIATATASDSLPVAAADTIDVEATIPAGEGGYVAFYAKENLNGTYCLNNWGNNAYVNVHVTARYACFAIVGPDGYSLYSDDTVDFGYTNAESSREFMIKNDGTAPLAVTGVALPKGFSASDSVFSVEAGGSKALVLTLAADTADFGPKGGSVVIAHALGTFAFAVKGTTVNPVVFFTGFEDGRLPESWTPEDGWTVRSSSNGNHYAQQGSHVGASSLTTQLLTVGEGESLTFQARRLYSDATDTLAVLCSTDKEKWTLLKEYDMLTSAFQNYKIGGLPAGNYYFRFFGQYVAIDNVMGFREASDMPQMAVTDSVEQPFASGAELSFGVVSADSTVTLVVKNVGTGVLRSSLSVGECFTVSPDTLLLTAGEQQSVSLTLNVRPYGEKHDSLVIQSDGLPDFVLHLVGISRDPEVLYVDFQDQQWPAGWTAEGKWMVTWETFGHENYWAEVVDYTNSLSMLTTDKVRVDEGDVLTLSAMRYDSYQPRLLLSVSTDCCEWTTVADLTSRLDDTLSVVSVEGLPLGPCYLRFEGSNVMIDNITGVHLASADDNVPQGIAEPVVRVGQGRCYDLRGISVGNSRRRLYIRSGKKIIGKSK